MEFTPDCLDTGWWFVFILVSDINLINLISITEQTEEKLENAEAETELDIPTQSPGKMIGIQLLFFLI